MAETVSTLDRSGNLAANALLSTKLFIPQARHLQDVLPRPRLVERLKTELSGKLTLISAPAGFGKTTLLAEWLPQSGRAVCWLSLDEADNDLTRFLTYFIAALQRLKPNFGQVLLVALQSPQPPAIESLITALVNEIVQTLDEFALVLDDYHLIHLPAIHAGVAFLLNNLPPNMHLILASRADPPLPLARLRVRGQLTELRAADLRFTLDEVTTFFEQIKELPLSADQIKELETRTEGWGAGLHLAALSLQGLDAAGISRFIRDFTGSHRYVFDYLAEEVLQQQPEEIQRFLLRTSILSRLCGPLCDTVLGRGAGEQGDRGEFTLAPPLLRSPTAAQNILEYLEHTNLFLIPLDDRRRWYRYHHLFAQVLLNRLQQTQPDSVPELHRRASGWYAEERLVDEAVNHALAGRDFEQAARLIEAVAGDMVRRGSIAGLIRWLDAMPETTIRARPRLCLARAWTFHWGPAFSLESADEWAQLALRTALANGSLDTDLTGEVAALQTMIAGGRSDWTRTLEFSRQALDELPPDSPWRSAITLCVGNAHIDSGDLAAASRVLGEALRFSQADGVHYIQLVAATFLADIQVFQGHLDRAMEMYQQVLVWADHGIPQKGGVMAHGGQANILCERNQLDAALAHVQLGADQLDRVGGAWSTLVIYRVLARVQQARGNWTDALDVLDRAYQIGRRAQISLAETQAAALRARLQLAQGDLRAAAAWAANSGLSLDDAEASRLGWREVEYLTLARVLGAQGRYAEALLLLDRLMQSAQAEERNGSLIAIHVLQALIIQTQGNMAHALTFLERALVLAEPEGYVRIFVDEGEPMAQLLSQAVKAGLRPDYASQLLAAFPTDEGGTLRVKDEGHSAALHPSSSPGAPRSAVLQPLVEPLSKRELEILSLMAQGLTNLEIAQQVFISAQTVKVHTRNIYGKLGVNSRQQAVSKARDLGLLT
jgi:LuxR family transcriptional regulator, maltose regulon positive regulatory protein